MARLKLTKTVVETAQPEKEPYELRDAAIPGFLLKVTPTGRKVFMVAYIANNGQRRKPAIGRFGEITVEQARAIIFDPNRPMSKHTYSKGWRRILGRAGLKHIGTHGIRHRSATDIANSGIPVKVGMALTAHKTVTMFMRYVHTEDDPVRAAADAVAFRRQGLIGGAVAVAAAKSVPAPITAAHMETASRAERDKPLCFEDGNYRSRTKLGNYRPFRHRRGPNRAVPIGTKRTADESKETTDARG